VQLLTRPLHAAPCFLPTGDRERKAAARPWEEAPDFGEDEKSVRRRGRIWSLRWRRVPAEGDQASGGGSSLLSAMVAREMGKFVLSWL
jgi:hypothetical protein